MVFQVVDLALTFRDKDPNANLAEFSLASRRKQVIELIAR